MGVIPLRLSLPEKAEYFGMYPRFLFMKFVSERVKAHYHPQEILFLKGIGEILLKPSASNRMIFTDMFRSTLRAWQFMQILVPFYLN